MVYGDTGGDAINPYILKEAEYDGTNANQRLGNLPHREQA